MEMGYKCMCICACEEYYTQHCMCPNWISHTHVHVHNTHPSPSISVPSLLVADSSATFLFLAGLVVVVADPLFCGLPFWNIPDLPRLEAATVTKVIIMETKKRKKLHTYLDLVQKTIRANTNIG